ncbi:hypothetical protein ZHAS_00016322 [Anopheles sinensis]|uniref:Uncharacterized protein n=1 Tax=Anopheles sinensis TaxID=74873 RepID=A0A084WDP4_ANOSI|nr:hypothetical protein ZHAS_00016322 [Anopheles sinensis]
MWPGVAFKQHPIKQALSKKRVRRISEGEHLAPVLLYGDPWETDCKTVGVGFGGFGAAFMFHFA